MRLWATFLVALTLCAGCTNAPQVIKDADDLAVQQLGVYNEEVALLIRNNQALLDAKLKQNLISAEDHEKQSAALQAIAKRGKNLHELECAINAWLHEDLEWGIILNEAKNAIISP